MRKKLRRRRKSVKKSFPSFYVDGEMVKPGLVLNNSSCRTWKIYFFLTVTVFTFLWQTRKKKLQGNIKERQQKETKVTMFVCLFILDMIVVVDSLNMPVGQQKY